jgi:DNA polymerase (family 10)
MSSSSEVAAIFYAIADLLDLQGERFKPEAYRRAARSIESLGEDLRKVAQRGALDQIPGVGEALREKILEYLRDGRIAYYDRLQGTFPPGVLELMRIPGIGPKTVRRFYIGLQIDGPAALRQAIDAGRLDGMAGFGPRKIAKLREALQATDGAAPAARTPLFDAWRLARSIVEELARRTPVEQITAAGSLRRCRESVGDLDILVTSARPSEAIRAFVALAGIRQVLLQGDTKATVVHEPGIQVDLRVVEPASFGAALQYFTGSKDHNIHLRSLARDSGLKINEYGVFRGEERVAGATEAEVYATLGLPWIPAEIRENLGEIEAAAAGRLPELVSVDRIQGELHRHAPDPWNSAWLTSIAAEARRRNFRYLGVVVPGSLGTSALTELTARVRREWAEMRPGSLQLRLGREMGLADPPSEETLGSLFDYVIGVPPPKGSKGPPRPPGQPPTRVPTFIGHLPFGPAGGDAPREAVVPWLEWCRKWDVALEVTPKGAEDGVDAAGARWAHEAGVALVLSAGSDDLSALELAIGRARRAWVPIDAVVNARDEGAARSSATAPTTRRRRSGAER